MGLGQLALSEANDGNECKNSDVLACDTDAKLSKCTEVNTLEFQFLWFSRGIVLRFLPVATC